LALVLIAGAVGVGEQLAIHPHSQAYVNPWAGGPAAGPLWVVDNSSDAGQALSALRDALRRRGSPAVYLGYFGQGEPASQDYRIRLRALPIRWDAQQIVHQRDDTERFPRYLAISSNPLQLACDGAYRWLLAYQPIERPGWTILLYDLEPHPETAALLALSFAHGALAEPRAPSEAQQYLEHAVALLQHLRAHDADQRYWEQVRPVVERFLREVSPRSQLFFGMALRDAGYQEAGLDLIRLLLDGRALDTTLREHALAALRR
jgi:hypothetical protein